MLSLFVVMVAKRRVTSGQIDKQMEEERRGGSKMTTRMMIEAGYLPVQYSIIGPSIHPPSYKESDNNNKKAKVKAKGND